MDIIQKISIYIKERTMVILNRIFAQTSIHIIIKRTIFYIKNTYEYEYFSNKNGEILSKYVEFYRHPKCMDGINLDLSENHISMVQCKQKPSVLDFVQFLFQSNLYFVSMIK